MARLDQPHSTFKPQDPKPQFHWCAIFSATLVELGRWIKVGPSSAGRKRSL
jgi:hypothetical protein